MDLIVTDLMKHYSSGALASAANRYKVVTVAGRGQLPRAKWTNLLGR